MLPLESSNSFLTKYPVLVLLGRMRCRKASMISLPLPSMVISPFLYFSTTWEQEQEARHVRLPQSLCDSVADLLKWIPVSRKWSKSPSLDLEFYCCYSYEPFPSGCFEISALACSLLSIYTSQKSLDGPVTIAIFIRGLQD